MLFMYSVVSKYIIMALMSRVIATGTYTKAEFDEKLKSMSYEVETA